MAWCPPVAPWQIGGVSEPVAVTGQLVEPAEWVALPDVAEQLGLPITRVHQLVRDRALLAVRREGVLRVPVELIATPNVRKHLPGVLTLLHDAGYNDEEALRWLYTADDSLPGIPANALSGARATEVKRRAQALGF
jgi:Rv2175c C-terminal domain of unknown function